MASVGAYMEMGGIGCGGCLGWFHGVCISVTPELSRMSYIVVVSFFVLSFCEKTRVMYGWGKYGAKYIRNWPQGTGEVHVDLDKSPPCPLSSP